jgi:hypothetical protein
LLQAIDRSLLDAQPVGDAEWHTEVGSDVEELVLDPVERSPQPLGQLGVREDDTDRGVQLVDCPERADPAIELRHP